MEQVAVDEALVGYMLAIVGRTREHEGLALGVSPRGAQALYPRVAGAGAGRGPRLRVARRHQAAGAAVFAHRVVLDQRASLRREFHAASRGERAYLERDPAAG